MKKLTKFILNPYMLIPYLGTKELINWIPDSMYIKLAYRARMNKKIDLDNPKTFNEKLQWLKLYNRNPEYTKMVDKYEVRKYISETIGEEYLIPLLGVYDKFEDIDFDKLPNEFVLKSTHDSGGVVICKDKSKFNKDEAQKKINQYLKRNFYYHGREWPYKYVTPKIICEKYMVDDSGVELKDYKFMCFNGTARCVLVCSDRNSTEGVKMDFYDEKWNKIKCKRPQHPNSINNIQRPKNFKKMLELSEELSKDIPFIRVDFYEINEKIYFGELTFYPASGFDKFNPDVYDEILGSWLKLPNQNII